MNQMKLYRCIRLIQLLKIQSRQMATIKRYLNVSERTVYRYFNLFNQLGYEIHKDQYNKYYLVNTDTI